MNPDRKAADCIAVVRELLATLRTGSPPNPERAYRLQDAVEDICERLNILELGKHWICGAPHGYYGLVETGKPCSICEGQHERKLRETVDHVLQEERERGGPAASVSGCPGCGIKRADAERVGELEETLRKLIGEVSGDGEIRYLGDATSNIIGKAEHVGTHGSIIVIIDRRALLDAMAMLTKKRA